MLYVVTGLDVRGRRFRMFTSNYMYAMSINLWRGSVWEQKEGKRKLLKRVRN